MVRALIAGLVLLALPLSGPNPVAAVEEPATWEGAATGIGGTGRYDAGEWIWQDFVYDDGGQADNTADIVELRLRKDGDALAMRITLNSLQDAASTVVGVGFAGPSPAVRDWPGGAGVRSGWDTFVTIADGGATVHTADGSSGVLAVTVDLAENTLEVRVPGQAGDDQLQLTAGAGTWSASGHSWQGSPVDLAFNRHADEPFGKSSWRDSAQSAAIASGDVTSHNVTVDAAALDQRRSDPVPVKPGLYNRIYRSRQALGEGYGDSFPRHRGLYQPYTVYVPEAYDPDQAAPLRLILHSLNNTHNEYSATNVYRDIAEPSGALAVTPLALGTDGWYWDEALVDTLEAWRDAEAHYAVDAGRTTVSGYSMGGYGSYRLVTLLPERFAGAALWAGVPAYTIWAYPADPTPAGARQGPGNTSEQLENTRHVPLYISHGTNDPLVPLTGVVRQAQRLEELGHEHRLNVHPGFDHYTFRTLDVWTREGEWLRDRTRMTDPATVTFKVRPASWVTASRPPEQRAAILDHLAGLGAELDSAYWVRDVVTADEAVTGVVDLTSQAHRLRDPVTAAVNRAPSDYPLPYAQRGTRLGYAPAAAGNALRGSLTDVTELTVDLARAGLHAAGLEIDITVDRQVRLRLIDGPSHRELVLHPNP